MRIFLRTFNDSINSKTGSPLPEGAPRRGTPEWLVFQKLLIESLNELGHICISQKENPLIDDDFTPIGVDRMIYVHHNKRDKPEGDLFWMQMHMRELFTIDTNGWGADASNNNFKPGDNIEEAQTYCNLLSEKLYSGNTSKIDQPRETDETPGDFILVPLQVPRDYTIKNHSPITVRYFTDSIMSWAEETGTHVCIKMHPNNKVDQDLHQSVDEGVAGSKFIHKVEGNIHELIKRSSGLFVINSGTGFESLIHGRPVATFGNCDYNKVTFNADIRRLDEACQFIHSYKDEWRRIGYSFVKWYWTKHAYDVTDAGTKARLTEYLKGVL